MNYRDQTGHEFQLKGIPDRVVSIVPSQSEFLWDLGAGKRLSGITRFCIHPPELYNSAVRVGGTKNLSLEKVRALNPDLIIANKEENGRAQIEALQKEFPVWTSDITEIDHAYDMMRRLGIIFGREDESARITERISASLERIRNIFKGERCAYFIWNKPYMLAGKNTFINSVLEHLGFMNAAGALERYPEISADDLKQINPEYCFLSSEPFPFKERHADEIRKIIPGAKIFIVDGEVFSWYGTRLLKLESYVRELTMRIA